MIAVRSSHVAAISGKVQFAVVGFHFGDTACA